MPVLYDPSSRNDQLSMQAAIDSMLGAEMDAILTGQRWVWTKKQFIEFYREARDFGRYLKASDGC